MIKRYLWGESATVFTLLAAAAVTLFAKLGAAELWTQEGRWEAISAHMISSGDFLHPYLYGSAYYDKPLLSYWLMLAASWIGGRLDEAALRVPSALSGLFAVWCIYRLGTKRFDRSTGLMAGFLLASCYMFVFWSRVASADMLNLAGILAAVIWYFERRDRPGLLTSTVLCVIVAVACLTKGLVAAAVVGVVLLPDLLRDGYWRRVLQPSLAIAALFGLAVYLAPFLASSAHPPPGYSESGLSTMVRENVVRYFAAFDHQEPVYIYLLYLPVYLLPWSLLLPFVVWSAYRRWPSLSSEARWPIGATVLVFALLTGSGSRRSYYILPILPFAVLMIAEWLSRQSERGRAQRIAGWGVAGALGSMLLWFGLIVPAGFRHGGERLLVREVRRYVEQRAPWKDWRIVICGAPPAAGYYFRTAAEATVISASDARSIAPLLDRNSHTIVVTKRRFLEDVRAVIPAAAVFEEPSLTPRFLRSRQASERDVIALVPSNPASCRPAAWPARRRCEAGEYPSFCG